MRTIFIFLFITLHIGSFSQVPMDNHCDSLLKTFRANEALLCYYNLNTDDLNIDKKFFCIALCHSRLGNIDSAFYYIDKFRAGKYKYLEIRQPEFLALHNDTRWERYLSEYFELILNDNAQFDTIQAKNLYGIYQRDQQYRAELEYRISNEMDVDSLITLQSRNDSINEITVLDYIENFGWPKKEKLGNSLFGSNTFFLVIQHSDIGIQKRILPIIMDEAKNGNADWKDYAYLKDRVLINEGRKQLYGTQYYYDNSTGKYELFPVEDPDNLLDRRREVGLN